MRVLHVHSGNLYGGVETLFLTLARYRHLVSALRPHFALCFEGRLSQELTAAGVDAHMLGGVRVRRPVSIWRARRALRALLARESFDVVICHSAWSQAIFGPVVRRGGVPLVFWLHDVTKGQHWLERWARLTRPDLVICNSHFTARSVAAMYRRVRVEVLRYPLPPLDGNTTISDRGATRGELGTPAEATVIVQVSRLEPYKGHALHLEALGHLRDLAEPWECWIVGGVQRPHEARYLDALERIAARLGIAERVRFLGQRSDVPRVLAAADIHCQPNTGPEPFGVTFVEALMAGLPIVTSAFGGALEIVDESCGILVPPGDATALAAALRRLIQDPILRREIGAAGPARARKLCEPATQMRRLNEILGSASRSGAR